MSRGSPDDFPVLRSQLGSRVLVRVRVQCRGHEHELVVHVHVQRLIGRSMLDERLHVVWLAILVLRSVTAMKLRTAQCLIVCKLQGCESVQQAESEESFFLREREFRDGPEQTLPDHTSISTQYSPLRRLKSKGAYRLRYT